MYKFNAKTESSWTALHGAAHSGHKGAVELLIKKGAKVNVKNNEGETPLDVAKTKEIEKILKKVGGKSGKDL